MVPTITGYAASRLRSVCVEEIGIFRGLGFFINRILWNITVGIYY